MESRLMKTTRYRKAFTLAELLVTLVVTSIILLAVTTLAFAMSSATRASDDTVLKEAQLRQARLRIGELIRNCKLICAAPGNDLAVWRADSNNDGGINVCELVYIERGDGLNVLRLCEFSPADGDVVTLESLALATTKELLVSQHTETYASLIPVCENVQFHLDATPPFTRRVNVSFGLRENGVAHSHEVNVALRGWGGNLLSADGTTLAGDDD
jgi:prepilin-type N-terminal cleavage/methylation domain-containing protein